MRRLLLLTATLFAGLVLSTDSYCPESTSCCSGFSEKRSLPAAGTCPAILDKDGNPPPDCPYGSLPGWSGPTPGAVCTEKGTRFTFDTKTQTDFCGQNPEGSLTINLVGDNVVIRWDTAGLPYGEFSATVSSSAPDKNSGPGGHLYKSGGEYCPAVTYPAVPTCTIPLAKFLQDAGVTTCDPTKSSDIYVAAHLNIDPNGPKKDTCWAGDQGSWPRLYFSLNIKCVEYCKSYCCCAPPPPPEPCPSTEAPFCGTGSCPTDTCNTNTHSVDHWGKLYQDTCCCTADPAPACTGDTPRDCTPASGKMRMRSLFGDVKFARASSLKKRTFTCSEGTPSCPTDPCTGQVLDTGCKCCCPPETKQCSDTAYPDPGGFGGTLDSLMIAGKKGSLVPCTTAWGSYLKLADGVSTSPLNFVSGAGQNNWSGGTVVGIVMVSRIDKKCVEINVDMTGTYSTGKYHINVSCGPNNAAGLGTDCRTPGKYNNPSGCNPSDPYSTQICLPDDCNEDIIVIIHGEILKQVPLSDTSCSAYTCS